MCFTSLLVVEATGCSERIEGAAPCLKHTTDSDTKILWWCHELAALCGNCVRT